MSLFRWPHYGAPLTGENLSVQVVNCSHVFSSRPLGTLVISLQQLQSAGRLVLREALVDENLRVSPIQVELDLKYQPPEGAAGAWAEEDFGALIRDSSELIIPNVGFQELEPGEARLERRAVALGRRLARSLGPQDDDENELDLELELDLEDEPDVELSGVVFSPLKSRAQSLARGDPFQMSKAQDFQVGVTVLEAQKLVGVNINPYVAVRVGEQRRVTATQRGTNCPFYNEYFLFEFHETQLRLQDLLLEITVFHSQSLPFMATRIGTFRMDLGIVFDQPDGHFYQKWAPLHDPQDTRAGTKGFVKVTLSVRARGDLPPPLPLLGPGHSSDIDKNLLLPRGIRAERPWARLRVRVYRAEGLPALRPGLLGSLARALHDQRVLVDPYVRVSFLGQQGETSVRSEAAAPEWNEQLNFVELFPPLTRGLRLQLRDDAPLLDAALATHVLDLKQISHPGRAAGFNPTFGPAWIPLYGSPPSRGVRDGLQSLNEGVGQGIWFRGRLLVAVSMEVFEGRAEPEPPQTLQGSRLSRLTGKKKKKARQGQIPTRVPQQVDTSSSAESPEIPSAMEVEVEELLPLPENALAPCEDFLLFGVLFEATMIDPTMALQPISFEISIGHAGRREEQLGRGSRAGERTEGNLGEAQPLLESKDMGTGLEEEEEVGTPAQRPEPVDGSGPYLCLPLRHHKPCVHVWSRWEDYTWRLQISNCVHKVAERLSQGLQEVEKMQRRSGLSACTRLKQTLEELVAGSRQFCRSTERRTMTRPNNLDRCRGKLLMHSLNLLAKQGLRLLRGLRQANMQKKVTLAKKLLAKLRFLAQEAPGAAPGEVCAKLELFLWLGLGKQAKACTSELPPDLLPEPSVGLPHSLYRDDFSYFQLRAHLYQARGVLAADDSGLSDPFARVLISTQCQTTRVLEQTLSPLWDELLVFDQLIVDGRREHLQEEPPLVVISVFDHNKLGPPVFLGRALAAPRVKLVEEPYQHPELQFFPMRKGPRAAGELIATFELIELDYRGGLEPSVPSDVEPQDLTPLVEPLSGRLSLPPNVRPVLREFRVEVAPGTTSSCPLTGVSACQVLFWGLRGLGRVHLFEVEQPQIVLEVAGRRVESEVLASYRENPNFTELVTHLTVDLPEQPYLQPPLSILVIERRAFGRTVLVGSHIVPHMLRFILQGHEDPSEEEGEEEEAGDLVPKEPQGQKALDSLLADSGRSTRLLKAPLKKLPLGGLLSLGPELEEDIPDPEELDWWSKYYASLQELQGQPNLDEDEMDEPGDSDGANLISVEGEAKDQGEADVKGSVSQKRAIATLKVTGCWDEGSPLGSGCQAVSEALPFQIYTSSLEEEFHHFEDWLNVFPLYRGQGGQDGDAGEEGSGHLVGKFKGSFLIYPESEAVSYAEPQISRGIPQNRPIKLLVRVYVVKGSLHMWIDIFPSDVPAPPAVDIKPRKPISYELRVVIWNTEDVVLDDVNPLTGEMSSDIYVKSWVKGLEHDKQETDVHFNSLTGEGNFNWRFVFRFDYLPTEREVSVQRRPGPFALEEAEFRQPAVLVLQVWDYDRISANDFLGSLELQLPDMVRGARDPEHCSVRLAQDGAGPRCNLFRCRRLRGWWPVVKLREAEDLEREDREAQASKKRRKQKRRKGRPEDLEFTDTGGNVHILTGKVEAEFELLTVEEAEKRPVGKGRKEPEPLEKPNRPKTSFNWFVNPLKTFVFFILRRYWRILVLLLVLALLTVFLLLVFYTIPGQISEVIFSPLHKPSD
ncbi:Hypothetical predicted protein [Marmota monax]|uniref:C2 domain-containing protein n=1 Tax=Marmota monax TaxID=9995 RepID=A0A5E4CA74_MARMO|nr:Hypothetical predicted protein [Marmota monax]